VNIDKNFVKLFIIKNDLSLIG